MTIKRKTNEIRTWKKHLFLDISSTNIDILVPSLYLCVETRSMEVLWLLYKPLPYLCFNPFVISETFATKVVFQKRGKNVNSASYCEVLLKLRDAIRRKRLGPEEYCFIMTMPVAETTVKRLLCCGFRRTGKAMRQVYQCWWRICLEIHVFFRFESHLFYVLLPSVAYLLTPLRSFVGGCRYFGGMFFGAEKCSVKTSSPAHKQHDSTIQKTRVLTAPTAKTSKSTLIHESQ
jgi:hypothetical protein